MQKTRNALKKQIRFPLELLAEKTFVFSPAEFIVIHRRLFDGILDGINTSAKAGKLRRYNISKEEWVLNGDSVYYASADSIKATLDYDFETEKSFDYSRLSKEETVKHIAKFISDIWQIHPFGEGNTRATAVFTIKYLRRFGFNVNNDLFASNSWYFRNALVRANFSLTYSDVHSTMEYLERFFFNLVLNKNYDLKNREMQIKVDTVNKQIDTVNKQIDTVNKQIDTVNTQFDTVNKKFDTVNTQIDTVNDTVFDLIKSNNKITIMEISNHFGISISTVKRRIKELKEKGYIEKIGSDKIGTWKVIKDSKVN